MTYDSTREEVVLFGGADGQSRLQDTWTWDGSSWSQQAPLISPSPRVATRLAFDVARDRVVLFGGWDGVKAFNDTWEWDGSTWNLKNPPQSPPARHVHGMAYDPVRQRVVLFGGLAGPWQAQQRLSDTWEWDGTTWDRLSPANPPSRRYSVGMAYDSDRNRVVLFGGFGGGNDTWEWDGQDWAPRSLGTAPPPREMPLMAYDSTRQTMVVFGGWNGTRMSDTWELRAGSTSWIQVTPTTSPPANWNGSITYDAKNAEIVLFGGQPTSGPVLSDTWLSYNPNPAEHLPLGMGCPGTAGTPSLNPDEFSLPWIGETFNVRLSSLPPGIINVPFGILGASKASLGSTPLPVALGSIGMVGCTLYVSVDHAVALTNQGGQALWSLSVPNHVALIGARFYQQGLILDPGANPLGAIMTNAGEARIGAR